MLIVNDRTNRTTGFVVRETKLGNDVQEGRVGYVGFIKSFG